MQNKTPVIRFVAPSGTGKTTLMRQVITLLAKRGLKVAAIKQARDDFDIDRPDKDSYKLRKAGVERLILGSEQQSAHVIEQGNGAKIEPHLEQLLTYLDLEHLDIVLVEGFNSSSSYAKIALYRQEREKELGIDVVNDSSLVAIATDNSHLATSVPILDINDPERVADFICEYSLATG